MYGSGLEGDCEKMLEMLDEQGEERLKETYIEIEWKKVNLLPFEEVRKRWHSIQVVQEKYSVKGVGFKQDEILGKFIKYQGRVFLEGKYVDSNQSKVAEAIQQYEDFRQIRGLPDFSAGLNWID